MLPRISILMPVWNGEKYLAEAVDSILAQTFVDFELLVIDDGSTDRTPEILRAYCDPRLRVLTLDHAGIVVALNHGMSEARAQWIARQDADDVSVPVRLERQWDAAGSHPEAVLVHTDVEFINERKQSVGRARLPRSRAFTALRLCYQCPIVHSTVLFKKSVAVSVGGYRREERHAEDFSLWGRMLEQGEFVGIPEKLVRFRIHEQSVSYQNLARQQELARQIGIDHCRRFMRLTSAQAIRAHAILTTAPRRRSLLECGLFLSWCGLRFRWQSLEVIAFLVWQTAKSVLRIK